MIKMFKGLSAAALMLCGSVSAEAAVLSGGYDGTNFNDGIMFDVRTLSAIDLTSLAVNADFGTFDYQVFYRAGGVGGFQNDPAAWTPLGSFAALTTSGYGAATTLDIADMTLGTGLHGFYITDGGAFSIYYGNSAASSGSVQAANAQAQLLVGYGISGNFGDATADRAFNGSITYAAAVPEPAIWATMMLGFGAIGFAARRRRQHVSRVRFA
ncbi:PEPxxWA-CTERM sorting domain-containing protein [Sphingomonas sp. RS2018]